MLRRIAYALLPVLFGALLAVGATPPAQAAPGDTSTPWTSLPNGCGDNTTVPTSTGWSDRTHFAAFDRNESVNDGAAASPRTHWVRAQYVTLLEPCRVSSNVLGFRWQAQSTATAPAICGGGSDACTSARAALTLGVVDNFVSTPGAPTTPVLVTCKNTSGDTFSVAVTGLANMRAGTGSTLTYSSSTLATVNNCAELVTISVVVSSYTYRLGSTAAQWQLVTWSAERYESGIPYDDSQGVDGGLESYCRGIENLPGGQPGLVCEPFWTPNPISWEDTCGEQQQAPGVSLPYATFNPVDGSTWGPAAGWLAYCLFVPLPEVGGFDRNDDVAEAWAASPNAEAGEQLVGLADAWQFSEGCGVLINMPPILGGGAVDTCSWTWAAPVKAIIGFGVIALAGFWFLQFIADTSWSLMRNAPKSPLG